MKTLQLLALTVLFAAVLLLAGCSGSGVSVEKLSGVTVRTTATDHLNTIALLLGWLRTLYYKDPGGAGPSVEVDEVVDDPQEPGEFLYHIKGTNSDGSGFEVWMDLEDGSGSSSVAWPGVSVKIENGPGFEIAGVSTVDSTEVWSTGLRLEQRWQCDFNQRPVTAIQTGQASVHNGPAMSFRLERRPAEDWLRLELPGNTVVTFRSPITSVPGALRWPLISGKADVTYQAPGDQLTYKLTGTGAEWWDHMAFTSPSGFAGDFGIGADLSGSGQLREGGTVCGALTWNAALQGSLSLLGSGSEEVSPSASIRDYRLDQWVHGQARLGASPMY